MDIADLYAEKRYFDLWSIVHAVTGVVVAGWLLWLDCSMLWVVVISEVLFVGWEIFEAWKGIQEYLSNRISDIVFDSLGMGIALWAVWKWDVEFHGPMLWLLTFAAVLLGLGGLLAYQRRADQQA